MNYLDLVLSGYYNDNTREYLSKYFIRELKKAEKEHYEADEFFNGCLKAVHTVEEDLSQQMHEDKKGLYIAIDEAKKRTLGFDDNEGMEYDQLRERTISECKLKLKEITINDYSVNLYYLTKGKFIRHIFGDEVLYIKMAILEAQKNNMPQQLQGNKHLLNVPTRADQEQILDFWFRLMGNNEKGEPYWEDKEIEHFVYQNFDVFPGVNEIKEFNPNMNKSELNQVIWTFQHNYGMPKTKKQYEKLLMLNFTKFKDDKNVYSNIKDYSNEHLKKLFK